jgi:molecular chaperone DnaJ
MKQDFYELLGVDRNASADEIKRAYRRKAMDLHPDRTRGDKEKEAQFKQVNEAYSVLSDEQKKQHYDRYGTAEPQGFGGGAGGFGFDFDMGDIFSSFFGQDFSTRGRRKAVGEPIEVNIKLTFQEAYQGLKKTIDYTRFVLCKDCGATGAKAGSSQTQCHTCHGTGRVTHRSRTIFGYMENQAACDECHGAGSIIREKCPTCRGEKRIREKTEKTIDIPAGIDDGMTMKLNGEGNEGEGGRGDLLVSFVVPQEFQGLVREDNTITYQLPIDITEAVLGVKKTVQIPVLGEKKIEIIHGSRHGETILFR